MPLGHVETVRIGKFQFRPAWVTTAVTVLLLPLFTFLGLWQLDRADQKKALVEHYKARSKHPPLQLTGAQRDAEAMRNRRVLASGRYDSERQLLLDNQIHRSRPGYHVITLFSLTGEDAAVLVNRGWVPLGTSRAELPDIRVGQEPRTIGGSLHVPSAPPLALGESGDSVPGWPKVIQWIDRPALERRLGTALLPFTVRLSPEDSDGYLRQWSPRYGTPPEKHHAYAVQWFGFAVLLVVLFVGLNLRRADDPSETREDP